MQITLADMKAHWQAFLCRLGWHVMWGLADYRPARPGDWRVCMRNRSRRLTGPQPCRTDMLYDGERWVVQPPLPPVQREHDHDWPDGWWFHVGCDPGVAYTEWRQTCRDPYCGVTRARGRVNEVWGGNPSEDFPPSVYHPINHEPNDQREDPYYQ